VVPLFFDVLGLPANGSGPPWSLSNLTKTSAKAVVVPSVRSFRREFQERRNLFFHKEGVWLHNISKQEKEELAEIAIR